MKQKTREYRAGPGPRKRKNDSDKSKQCHQAPGPAKLRAVHEPEQDSGHEDSNEGAEANGAKRSGTCVLRESRKFTGKERIKIAAENGFFHQWGDKHGHGHEQHGPGAALEELLNRNVIHFLDARAGDGHENGEAAAGDKIHPRTAFADERISAQFFPAERAPEGQSAQDCKGHVEKQEEQRVPENVGAYQKLWLGFDHLLKLLLGEMFVCSE